MDIISGEKLQGIAEVTIASEKKIHSIIFTSSVAVYGLSENESDENSILIPFNEYGKTKREAEKIFQKWHELITKEL
mgnify:CR=1 FL=1